MLWNTESSAFEDFNVVHSQPLLTLTFSKDDSRILTLCQDDRARLFSLDSSETAPIIEPIEHRGTGFDHELLVPPVFVGRSDDKILTKLGNLITLTDAVSGEVLLTSSMSSPAVSCIAVSPDHRYFVAAWRKQGFQVWDSDGLAKVSEFKQPYTFLAAEFTPDGLDLGLMTLNRVQRFDVQTGMEYEPPLPIFPLQNQICWSPNGRHLAIATARGSCTVWCTNSYLPHGESAPNGLNRTVGREVQPISIDGRATRLKLSRSGKNVLVCGSNYLFGDLHSVTVVDANSAERLDTISIDSLVLDACISSDDNSVGIVTLNRQVTIWDRLSNSQRVIAELGHEPLQIEADPKSNTVYVLEIDGKISAIRTSDGKTEWSNRHPLVVVPPYKRETQYHIYRKPNGFPLHFDYQLATSADGSLIVTSCDNGYVCVWDARNGQQLMPPIRVSKSERTNVGMMRTLFAISHNDRWLAVAGDSGEVWDLETKTPVAKFSTHSDYRRSVGFDSSDTRIAVYSGIGECHIWNWKSGKQVCPTIFEANSGLFVGNEDQFLFVRGNDHFRLYSASSGKPLTPRWQLGGFWPKSTLQAPGRSECFLSFGAQHRGRNCSNIKRVSFDHLLQPHRITPEVMSLRSEILSRCRIANNRVEQLPESEWTQRVDQAWENSPDWFLDNWESWQVDSWHRDQAARADHIGNQYAKKWHQAALVNFVDRD